MTERKAKSRSARQRAVYDSVIVPMKDFYEFSRDCFQELGRQKRQEKVFRTALLEVCRRQGTGGETVEEAVSQAAGKSLSAGPEPAAAGVRRKSLSPGDSILVLTTGFWNWTIPRCIIMFFIKISIPPPSRQHK